MSKRFKYWRADGATVHPVVTTSEQLIVNSDDRPTVQVLVGSNVPVAQAAQALRDIADLVEA